MNTKQRTKIEYMCTYCGKKEAKWKDHGRPLPGTCPRRTNNQPHRWIKNRILY